MTLSCLKEHKTWLTTLISLVSLMTVWQRKMNTLNNPKLANLEETNTLNIVFSGIWYFMSFCWIFLNNTSYEYAYKYCHPHLHLVHPLLVYSPSYHFCNEILSSCMIWTWMKNHSLRDIHCNIVNLKCSNILLQGMMNNVKFTFHIGDTTWVV